MTDVGRLQRAYVAARRDVSRAERDVSQATTLLAELEHAHTRARRGDPPDDLQATLDALEAEVAAWAYDPDDVSEGDEPASEDAGSATDDGLDAVVALRALQTDDGRVETLAALERAITDPAEGSFSDASAPLRGAVRAIEAFGETRRSDLGAITGQLTDAYPAALSGDLPAMDGTTPVLLLPTRLETRFVEASNGDGSDDGRSDDYELQVRVYPDDVHVDTHERELTAEEVRWGVHFWQQAWWASHDGSADDLRATLPGEVLRDVDLSGFPDDPERRHAAVLERAWNQLSDRFGPERAAWVKRELAPPAAEELLAYATGPVPAVDFEAMRTDADRRPDSWTRPPRARALPDRWVAVAETDGTTETAWSNPVSRPLSVGPDPDQIGAVTGETSGDTLTDGDLSWVFDFEDALDRGMALTLPLSEAQVTAGVDRLVVVGVSTALDPEAGGRTVADLLDAHQYTDGLSFVERGTPTNDTREDAAGTSPGDPPSPFDLACGDSRPVPRSDGARAASLLGVDPSSLGRRDGHVFDGVAGAADEWERAARAMNTALWPATWGYYLPHLLAPDRWTDAVHPRPEFLRWLESYRQHFVHYVRAGGPLPTLRVGDQPYGIVPTTDLDAWRSEPTLDATPATGLPATATGFTYERLAGRDAPTDLAGRLRSLRPVWADATARVPSIESPDDPEAVVADILSMAGTSDAYRLRDFLGEEVVTDLLADPTDAVGAVSDAKRAVTATLQGLDPGAETPRVGGLLATDPAPMLEVALVADDLDAYLRALRTSPHGALREGPPGAGLSLSEAPNLVVWLLAILFDGDDLTLAEVLFYHGLAETYRLARVRLGHHYEHFGHVEDTDATWRDTPWGLFPEPETYDDGDPTLWRALDQPISDALAEHPALDETTTYGEALRAVPELDCGFSAVVDALETLESVEEGRVERLLRETVDLATHRFDAWVTSLATRRLDGMREIHGGGLHVGAYGYVEDLQHDPGSRSAGYLQAPSVGQATTAAVLRSGYEAGRGGDAFAVDLSADRVREARRLVDAVRTGLPLGEALGYRFERGLHENYPDVELDRFVPAFRALAPLTEGSVARPGMSAADEAAEREVVDGVALVERWRGDTIPWGTAVGSHGTTLPTEGDPAFDAIKSEIEALETALDAVSDVLTAESVHQLVGGNPSRAGGSLDALSRGEAPPDLAVTETPRSGTACTHRLLALLDPEAPTWGPEDALRALAEPALNAWAGTLLGDPHRVVCRVAFEPRPSTLVRSGDADPETETDTDSQPGTTPDGSTTITTPAWRVLALRLSALDLCPLDLVYLVEGDATAWQSELEARIAHHVRRTRSDVDAAGEIRISFAPPSEWPDPEALGVDPATAVGFGPFLEAARGVREVVTSARAADGRDLTHPGEAGGRGLLRDPLAARADAVEPVLRDAATAMVDLAAVFERPEVDAGGDGPTTSHGETPASQHDRLGRLTDVLASLSDGLLRRVDRERTAVDPDGVGEAFAGLIRVANGDRVALGRDRSGDVVVDAREPVLYGMTIARPGTDVEVVARVAGRDVEFGATVGRSGGFEARLPEAATDALRRGDTFDVRVAVDESVTRATVTYGPRRGRPSATPTFVDPALTVAASLVGALNALSSATEPVRKAYAALDVEAVRAAVDHVDADAWPAPDDPTALDTVLGVDDIALPGFDDPDGWEEVGPVLLAIHDERLSREALQEFGELGLDPDHDALTDLTAALVDAVGDGLTALESAVDAAATDPAASFARAGCETLRAALLVGSDVGIHGSVPVSATGSTSADVDSLVRQASSVGAECETRLAAAAAAGGDAQGQHERLEALFGDAFEVLPPFTPPNAAELGRSMRPDHGETLLGSDPLAPETWFQRVARVRDVPRTLGQALTYGESLGDLSPAGGSRFQVAQLPFREDDTWVGLPAAWTDDHPTGRLSLVTHVHGEPRDDVHVGLFVDEFVETVPSDTQTTGLSFHYDKPGNRAPQTMLLAVPPTDEDWSLGTLADIVTESVELAKLRTVDAEALADVGHLLPATMLVDTDGSGGRDTAAVDTDDLGPPWWYRDGDGGDA